jgi:hypothetical protein
MTRWLRQGTNATVLMGQFVDSVDGATAKTALSLVQADVRLSKNGGDPAQKHEATTATHKENGYYAVPIDDTDTGTLGRLRIMITKATSLGAKDDFMVLPPAVFDAMVAGSDNLDVNAVQWNGHAVLEAVNGSPVVTLGATQTAYPPAQAGAEMTLTDDYDAAMTAATQDSVDTISDNVDLVLADTGEVQTELADDGRIDELIDDIKAQTELIPAVPAAVGSEMILSSAYDAAKTAATQTSVNTIDGIVDNIKLKTDNLPTDPADESLIIAAIPTVAEINAGVGGSETYTDTVLTAGADPVQGAQIEAYADSDRTTIVSIVYTDINGVFIMYLNPGSYYFRGLKEGYSIPDWSGVIS